jgi:Zn-dependent protease
MNLLPIPGLDGGHALFTIVEMITGKKLSDKAAGYVQTGGMIFLLTLMALTFGKDIYQLVVDKLSIIFSKNKYCDNKKFNLYLHSLKRTYNFLLSSVG